ncbi:hypothetical protein L9F63_013788 [Diploptera punctata]|uniref:Uncharacterized protein n=1 Tax=Diploptera punctata TaxID=6984 RepID=A0AAD8ELR3_DIPPU|nr:hypothetical protein L9F63_013788 [Diploptera punctata]
MVCILDLHFDQKHLFSVVCYVLNKRSLTANIIMQLVYLFCILLSAVSANEVEDMLAYRQKKDVSETYNRPNPDYRYSGYNGVNDNYNPYTKPEYYNNPYSNYNPAYNNRFYNRRNYQFEGRPYGPYGASNQQYYPGYYNNTRYQFGYQGTNNYPAAYKYPGYDRYNPGYDRYNQGYYNQGGYYNNPGYYNKAQQ